MNKCVKISILSNLTDAFLKNSVQKYAQDLSLEGFSQKANDQDYKIIVNGNKDNVDQFIDLLHKDLIRLDIKDFEIEPYVKDKDYRGVFRVIK